MTINSIGKCSFYVFLTKNKKINTGPVPGLPVAQVCLNEYLIYTVQQNLSTADEYYVRCTLYSVHAVVLRNTFLVRVFTVKDISLSTDFQFSFLVRIDNHSSDFLSLLLSGLNHDRRFSYDLLVNFQNEF